MIYLTFLGVAFAASCKKDDGPPPPETGIYRGVFSRIFDNGDTSGTGVVFLSIKMEDSTFTLNGDTSSMAPVSCNGDFALMGSDSIIFQNNAPVAIPEDPYYILDTVYTYEFMDVFFKFEFRLDTIIYKYDLERY